MSSRRYRISFLRFLNDSRNENVVGLICSQIDVLMLSSDCMMNIARITANIRQIYWKFPDSSLYNCPRIVSPGFLDFLFQNLTRLEERMITDPKHAPSANHKITKVKEELVTLCPYFSHKFDHQSEENETWLEAVDLIHPTQHAINSCISSWFVGIHPIWYHMSHLSDVFDRSRVVKTKVDELEKNTMCNAICLSPLTCFFSTVWEQGKPSKFDERFVGLEDEEGKIPGKVMREQNMTLDIVSIVGMGGLGKTTVVKNKMPSVG